MGRSAKIVTVVLVLVALGCLAYYQFMVWHPQALEEVREKKRVTWEEKTSKLQKEIVQLQDDIKKHETSLPEGKLVDAFGEKPVLPSEVIKEVDCEELKRQILTFFSYLDKKEYVKSYNWKGGVYEWTQRAVSKLSRERPVVSGETTDIYGLVKNMAHFYRMLGKKEVGFVKEVLANESDIVEIISALFYGWFSSKDRCKDSLGICPSNEEAMYEYAGFFLDTLAGRSYLLRRDSRIQALVGYYAVLVIHRANERHQNKYGIDIRPYIDSVLDNISNQMGLAHREFYIKKLMDLKENYATE